MIENRFSNLAVIYAQLVLFDAELDRPFNDWTSTHVDQGFSCRESSISFALNDRISEINLFINDDNNREGDPYVRIIIPIEIFGNSGINVDTLLNQYNVPIRSGHYSISFSANRTDSIDVDDIYISILSGINEPAIIVNDGSIRRTSDFLMSADPA